MSRRSLTAVRLDGREGLHASDSGRAPTIGNARRPVESAIDWQYIAPMLGTRSAIGVYVGLCLCACGDGGAPDRGATDSDAGPVRYNLNVLLTCRLLPTPCQGIGSSAEWRTERLGEDSYRDSLLVAPGFECVMRNLALRTPGLYLHATEGRDPFLSQTTHGIAITENGDVMYAVSEPFDPERRPLMPGELPTTPGVPGKLCVLKAPEYFESCAAALETWSREEPGEAGRCAYGSDEPLTTRTELEWFEACTEVAQLTCRSE